MDDHLYTLFQIWFQMRFPNEPMYGYYAEWKGRFEKGLIYAMEAMDSKSIQIWIQVVREKY